MAQNVAKPAVRTPLDPVANARRRVEEQRAAHGDRHPDYASSLIQLALLLIMHGQPAEAEPLLRDALDIRKEALGERHPDYATCLSSLAGLLWARGDLDAAEPLLRQALEIRCEVLGERHPKSVVSRNSLDQLLQARVLATRPAPTAIVSTPAPDRPQEPITPEPQEPAAPDLPREPVAEEVVTPPPPVESAPNLQEPEGEAVAPSLPTSQAIEEDLAPASRDELLQTAARLSDAFAGLGDRLTDAVRELQNGGPFFSGELIGELQDARERFLLARTQALRLAESAGVPGWEGREVRDLRELEALLSDVERAEAERARHGAVRARALAVLERVLDLTHADRAEFPPLAECQARARELARSLTASPAPAEEADATELAEGRHPLSSLLVLTGADEDVSDEVWAHSHEVVEAQFGRALAVAAARGRVVSRGQASGPPA